MNRPAAPFADRLHYAWIMAALTFVVLIGASGFRSAPGVLMVPLEDAFGWDRATISLAVSVNMLLFGFMGPFAAAAMERFGLRRVLIGALLTVASGALLTVFMTASWHLVLLWGVVVGLGTGSMATVLAATVANRWFVKRRGLVIGVLTAASATGQLVFLPVMAWLASQHGWKAVSIAVAAATLAVVPLVVVFARNRPEDVGLHRYGATGNEPGSTLRGNPIAAAFQALTGAVGSRAFWLLAGTFFICGATTNGLIGTHFIPAGIDHGMTEIAAANLLALIGIFDIVGTTASGWLTDRFNPERLLFAYYGLRGLSLILLPWAFDLPNFAIIAFVVFYGLDWVATVPPTIAIATKAFGVGQAALVYGWVFAAHQLGAASAAYAAGYLRTIHGDYVLAFTGAGALSLFAAALCLFMGRELPLRRLVRRRSMPASPGLAPEAVPVPAERGD
jgi:sugar phosphate permease